MFESKINRGRANGYAPLGSSGKVPLDYLPPIQSTLDTGSFATTDSNTFTGVQTLAGTSGTSWAELTIGQTDIFGNYNSYDIRATGSSAAGITLTSDILSVVGVVDKEFGPAGNNSVVFSGKYGFPYSDGPFTGIGVLQSGSQEKVWIYDYKGISAFPGDVNIGYTGFVAGEYSGSLNVNKGNINVSGSINTTGSLNIISGSLNVKGNSSFTGNINLSGSLNISSSMIISSTVVNNGNFEALNSDLIIDGGDIILSGSFAQQVNYAPMASGSWDSVPSEEVTQLDITKDIHLLDTTGAGSGANFHWYLPDGLYDGQVVRFALKGDVDTNPTLVRIWMNQIRTYNGTIVSSTTWYPFWDDGNGSPRSLATALFIDGAWNIDTDYWDM